MPLTYGYYFAHKKPACEVNGIFLHIFMELHVHSMYCMSPPYLHPSQQIVCVTCVVVVVGGEREGKLLALGGGEEGNMTKTALGKQRKEKVNVLLLRLRLQRRDVKAKLCCRRF